jgi:hypothetical protein
MIKRFSVFAAAAAVAATTLLSGCAADGEGATEQLAREEMEYTTGSNLPRKKAGPVGQKLTAQQAEELVRTLELRVPDVSPGK